MYSEYFIPELHNERVFKNLQSSLSIPPYLHPSVPLSLPPYQNKEMLGSDSSRLSSSSLSVSRENRGLDLSTSMSLTAIPSDHLEEVPLGASVDVE